MRQPQWPTEAQRAEAVSLHFFALITTDVLLIRSTSLSKVHRKLALTLFI